MNKSFHINSNRKVLLYTNYDTMYTQVMNDIMRQSTHRLKNGKHVEIKYKQFKLEFNRNKYNYK